MRATSGEARRGVGLRMERPNIVVIVTDEERAEMCYEDEAVRTFRVEQLRAHERLRNVRHWRLVRDESTEMGRAEYEISAVLQCVLLFFEIEGSTI